MDSKIINEIKKIIPEERRVLTKMSDLYSYSYDASFGTYLPHVVVQPQNPQEISQIMKLANQYRFPVVPRGQSSSLSGGPLPVKGGCVLDLSKYPKRLAIYEEDLIAVVTPSVLTEEIHQAAEAKGLMYPPDPSSSNISTIGGNLAENSGGPRGLKYGVTKHYVLGLEVVTPQGDIIRTGGKTVKNVTGYDLTQLIVGSEGTLGIITEAVLRLIPKPPASETMMAIFDKLVLSGEAISKILTGGILPSKMEIMDQASMIAVENFQPCGLPTEAEAMILIEVDGHPEAVKHEIEQIAKICKHIGAREIRVAKSDTEKAALWKVRKLVSPAIAKIKPTKISEDATVPRSKIPAMFQKLQEIKQKYNLHLVVFGHAGDGNLHPNIIVDQRDKDEMIRAEKAIEEIFQAAVELGGTLSGEHGIGTMKSPFMEMELGEAGLALMKAIKDAWDPHHVLNPGKIFPEKGQKLVLRS